MLHIIGIIISLFLSILLFTKKGKSKADVVLAIWLFFVSVHLFTYHLLVSGKFIEFPYFLGLEIAMPLLHGPFLFLYTALLIGKRMRKQVVFLHLLPTILVYLSLVNFFLLSNTEKIGVYQNNGLGYVHILKIIHAAILPSGIAYIMASLYLLKKHRQNMVNQVSDLEKINLNWLRNLIIGMCLIWLSILMGNDQSTFALVDLFILFIGYFGIKQVGLFTNKFEHQIGQQSHGQQETEKTRYEKSTLTTAMAQKVHQNLLHLMATEKLFKDPELMLASLASRLAVHPAVLSEVINTLAQQNFYDYINKLRIEEFKRIVVLPENQQFTLLALAYEVGFNAKTSFNRNFKKLTGLSPSAYLKEQQIQLQAIPA